MNALRRFVSPDGVLNWKRGALTWAAFMFLFWQGFRVVSEREITPRTIMLDLVLWSIAGLAWGRLTVYLLDRRARR